MSNMLQPSRYSPTHLNGGSVSDPDEIPLDLLLRGSIHRGAELLDENARLRARVADLERENHRLEAIVHGQDSAMVLMERERCINKTVETHRRAESVSP